MYKLISNFIVYRNMKEGRILYELSDIIRALDEKKEDEESLRNKTLDIINELLILSTNYGFDKNLWRDYMAYLLSMTENPFTLVSEKRGETKGTVNSFVMNDMKIFKELIDYDFSSLERELSINTFSLIKDYEAVKKEDGFINKNASLRIRELSDNLEKAKELKDFYDTVISFYREYGVGFLGMNKAFRVGKNELLIPIYETSSVLLSDLIGYEEQKKLLINNTESFILENGGNNVLLYGDAGTGKSTSIKALLNMYYERGLRIIEVYKHEFKLLPDIISYIKNRNYKFIIYMDDLSFEGEETEYKYLKAVIEGDLEVRPNNVLIYATSNRRHLIRESFKDRSELLDDIHKNDTKAERLSLSDRFGLTISYFKPDRNEFYDIIKGLYEGEVDDELLLSADRFAMRSGGMSGRTARQFIDHIKTLKENEG